MDHPAEDAKWSVLLLNDDNTPMDFVVDVIEQVFEIDLESARRLMLRVHNEGSVECGAYSQEMAKAKANQVNGPRPRTSASAAMCY